MHRADQAIREEARRTVHEHGVDSAEYAALRERGRAQDVAHRTRLSELVAERGWPLVSHVGEAAARGAFFVVQHADLEFQRALLPALRDADAAGELPPALLPLLEDRVRVLGGRPQIYGTQIRRAADGRPEPFPIEDESGVEARRAAAGLEPLDAYLRRFVVPGT